MRHARTASLLALLAACAGTPKHVSPPETEKVTFHSPALGNTRALRVLLPPGYRDEEQQKQVYPLLLVTDGEAAFDRWSVDEFAPVMMHTGEIAHLILVGIGAPDGSSHESEFEPWPDAAHPELGTPQGAQYPRFVLDELVPFLRARYRLQEGPASISIGGAGQAGFIALYTVVTRPGEIGGLFLESTPLHAQGFRIFDEAKRVTAWPARVSLGIGMAETSSAEVNRMSEKNQRQLADLIQAASPAAHVRLVIDPIGRFEAAAWRRRFPGVLRVLFEYVGPP